MADGRVIPERHRHSAHAIASRFGVPERQIVVAPRQGQVNLTLFLGEDLVLRLPRRPDLEQRLAKEAQVIPVVRARGVPTAALVAFDPTRTVADTAYIVLERLRGRTIDDTPTSPGEGDRTYHSLAEILVDLHALKVDVAPPMPAVETAEFDEEELLDQLVREGEIGASQAAWLREWFTRLEAGGARSSAPNLLHGDVMPSNLIMNDQGDVTAIIDWGSACWGEPSRDLAGFRSSTLPRMMHAYRAAAAGGEDSSLDTGVLWYQLFFALARLLGKPSTSEERNWSAPRAARLLDLMRTLSAASPFPGRNPGER